MCMLNVTYICTLCKVASLGMDRQHKQRITHIVHVAMQTCTAYDFMADSPMDHHSGRFGPKAHLALHTAGWTTQYCADDHKMLSW